MISILICSRTADIPPRLRDNISATIGVEYELVVIDNSQNRYSIFSAYNRGVEQAKFPYFCFMHDDIVIHTSDWGKKVVSHFERRKEIGCLGILGGHYMPNTPAYWGDVPAISGVYISNRNGVRITRREDKYFTVNNEADVVACDGVWFCIPRKLFVDDGIKFDDELFSGFHYYDMDICFRILQKGYVNIVISDVLIEHIEGTQNSMNENFYSAQKIFFEKWKHDLPKRAGVEIDVLISDFIGKYLEILGAYHAIENEKNRITQTKAYRLGKFLLKPFSVLRKK